MLRLGFARQVTRDSQKATDMSPKVIEKLFRLALIPLAAAVLVATGCSGSTSITGTQSGETGPAFVVGTDAPLASVVSFQVTLNQVQLTGTSGSTVSLVSGTPMVDFARYNGLQTLVDMNDVPTGTYTGITITLGSGTVSYLNTSGPGAPTIASAPATFSPSTVTVSFANPLTIGTKMPPVGVRLDFDLAKSIQVDSNGQIVITNGDVAVDPVFDIATVAVGDGGAHIDELIGGLVNPPTDSTEPASFVIQGPHGENFTINTTSSTEWDGGASLSELTSDGTSAVVAVAGKIDPSDQTLDADEVAIITDSKFYARGLVTYVTPSLGQATNLDFYVRAALPSENANVPLGGLAQVSITGNENYGIYWMHNAFTDLLFNADALAPGQEIAVGGPDPTASPFDVNRIHLQNWGYNGTIVAGSQDASQGTFQMQVNGFAGVVIPTTVTVYLGPSCDFRYGLSAFSDLSNGASIRVVGLLLKNSTNGQLVLLARHIDGVDFTNFSTAAWQ
jgi:hypothetical protein